MNRSVCASALVAAALISGCGGGGGSDEPTYNAAAAWQALVAPPTVRIITASGRASNGFNYSVQQRYTPVAGSNPFPRGPKPASRTDLSNRVEGNGSASIDDIETYYTGAGQIIGFRYTDSSPATCADVVTTLPPTAARVGASGRLYTSIRYSDCSPGTITVIGQATGTWSITSISGAPFFCYGETRSASGPVLGSNETCVQVATDGSLGVPVRITITEPNFSLVATGGP